MGSWMEGVQGVWLQTPFLTFPGDQQPQDTLVIHKHAQLFF